LRGADVFASSQTTWPPSTDMRPNLCHVQPAGSSRMKIMSLRRGDRRHGFGRIRVPLLTAISRFHKSSRLVSPPGWLGELGSLAPYIHYVLSLPSRWHLKGTFVRAVWLLANSAGITKKSKLTRASHTLTSDRRRVARLAAWGAGPMQGQLLLR